MRGTQWWGEREVGRNRCWSYPHHLYLIHSSFILSRSKLQWFCKWLVWSQCAIYGCNISTTACISAVCKYFCTFLNRERQLGASIWRVLLWGSIWCLTSQDYIIGLLFWDHSETCILGPVSWDRHPRVTITIVVIDGSHSLRGLHHGVTPSVARGHHYGDTIMRQDRGEP